MLQQTPPMLPHLIVEPTDHSTDPPSTAASSGKSTAAARTLAAPSAAATAAVRRLRRKETAAEATHAATEGNDGNGVHGDEDEGGYGYRAELAF